MEKILTNLPLIIVAISCFIIALNYIIDFLKKPSKEQIQQVKEILLYWVIEAEKKLGSGTGKLKLRYVYDMFIEKFPYVAKFLSFEQFSMYVDEALEEMKKLIESSPRIQQYISE